jgi:small basic protein
MILLGIIREVLACAQGPVGKQMSAYAEHVRKRRIFYIGTAINMVVGPVIDALAYAFAPQVVVAPLACLDVIFNALTAPYTLHWQNEQLTGSHFVATGLVALGAVLTALGGSVDHEIRDVFQIEEQLTKPIPLTYICIEAMMLSYLIAGLQMRVPLPPSIRGVSFGVIAGMLMGNVCFLKGFIGIVRTTVSSGDSEAWSRPTPYLLILAAVCGALLGNFYMQRGLVEYKGVYMVTVFEGAHIAAACLSGFVVMEEMSKATWAQLFTYWLGFAGIVAGILIMNASSGDAQMSGNSARIFRAPMETSPDGSPRKDEALVDDDQDETELEAVVE